MRGAWFSVLLGLGMVLAHASYKASTPAQGSVVKALPKTIQLELAEPVELKFSTFKVYALPSKSSDLKALHAEAGTLVEQVLGLKGDQNSRADTGLTTSAETASRLEIKLKDGLQPGAYVVMWRVLSVDTHVSKDYFVFIYQP